MPRRVQEFWLYEHDLDFEEPIFLMAEDGDLFNFGIIKYLKFLIFF